MANKSEIGWTRETPEGIELQVFARHVGNRWLFFHREKRFDLWQEDANPPLEDWMELLDGVRRRIRRQLARPEEEGRVMTTIRQRYPDAKF